MTWWKVLLFVLIVIVALLIGRWLRAHKRIDKKGGGLEIEKAYFNFDEESVRKKLEEGGAVHVGPQLFRLHSYVPPNPEIRMVRVRDEGHRITMTVKRKTDTPYDMESEVNIDSFDNGSGVMDALGIQKKYYLEKIRDIYEMGDAEVVFDTYPGLPPYIEVEAPTEESVNAIAARLGLRPDDPQDRGAGDMYLDLYGVTKERPLTDLTFGGVIDALGPLVTRYKQLFVDRTEKQVLEAERLRKRG
jgi:adenylate cyclase, class 2